jgi:hypothetical protein
MVLLPIVEHADGDPGHEQFLRQSRDDLLERLHRLTLYRTGQCDSLGYLTSESMRNIGRYIAITMTPTMQPTRIIIRGSMIDVSDWIAASTSSS